mmetsp:Transcript_1895/g.3882  ORF Transcript_1895/g.3882 Transcript_1895/m.3882 type:complete len:537 (-) Transcript_1895:31-1641(-)
MGKEAEVKADAAAAEAKKKEEPPKPVDPLTLGMNELKVVMQTLDKAVSTKEGRFMSRAIRMVTTLRRLLSKAVLSKAIETYLPESPAREQLVAFLAKVEEVEKMQIDAPAAAPPADAKEEAKKEGAAESKEDKESEEKAKEREKERIEKEREEAAWVRKMLTVPEAETLVLLLGAIFLLDQKHIESSMTVCWALIQRVLTFNRRTLDPLLSKAYFYWARCVELKGQSAQIRSELLSGYRTAVLKHDQIGQATILNLVLRNYLEFNLYEQADTLIRMSSFPEGDASNNQLARYLYYTGRVKAVQLEYTDAFRNLQQAARKAPQQSALGFRKTVYKLSVIVQLLLGEIPDRSIFSQKGMVSALRPYLHIAQAVRVGDLGAFHKAMQEHAEGFKKDKTYSLIVRMRHNVIKTGLKKINLAYSQISLADVCAKLHLESVEDTEFIVSKCILDGVIDAYVDHEAQTMISKANLDVYSTSEPQMQFHKRVAFCLDMHNQAVKAMRYAENTKTEWESAEERKERLRQEEEMMNSMDEEDDDAF